MHTDHDPVDPEELLKLGYEHRDVPPKPMAWAAFWLFAFTIGSGLLAALFIRIWNIVPEVPVEQRAFHKVAPPPGFPILQNNSDNTADIAELRRKEAEVLNNRADLHDGYYQIPVDVAIQDILKQGLPKTGTLPVTHPTVTPQGQLVNPVGNPPVPKWIRETSPREPRELQPSATSTSSDKTLPPPPIASTRKAPTATGAKKQ